jgi:four helix bundle protein
MEIKGGYMFFHERLNCYSLAKDLLTQLAKELKGWPPGYAFLADQLKRAGSSILLNLAEGNNKNSVKDRRRFFNIAKASAAEVASILDVAGCFGIISATSEMEKKAKVLQITKMIAKL